MADLYASRAPVRLNDGTADANNAGVINAAPSSGDYALEVRQIGFPAAAALADAVANPTLVPTSVYLQGYNGTTWDRLRSTTANGLAVDVTRVTGTVTVDTELAAAAAQADGAANPTIPNVGGFLSVFNGTTWDRAREVVAAQDTAGTGIQAAGILGQLDDVGTATVTENQFAPVRISTRRAMLVEGVASGTALPVSISGTVTVDSELAAAAALADATANPTIPGVGGFEHSFNGTTWDRNRNTAASDGNGALTTTGILAVGVGPGFARRSNPSNLGTATNSANTTDVNGAGTLAVEIGTTTTGTIIFEVTVDGTTWITALAYDVAGAAFITAAVTPTLGKVYLISVNGMRQARVRTASTLGATAAMAFTLSLGDAIGVSQGAANASVNLTQVGGAAVALGQTTMSASIPVTLASNQSALPVTLPTIAESDALANPTIPQSAAFLNGYNGTTWDRLRSSTANGLVVDVSRVQGTVTVDSELPAAAALTSDAVASPTAPAVGGFLFGYNGATWDRVRTANTGRLQVDVVTGGGAANANEVPASYNLISLYGTAAAVAAAGVSTGVVTNTPANTKHLYVRWAYVTASGQTKWQVKFGATVLHTEFNPQTTLSNWVRFDPPLDVTGDGATALTIDVTNREASAMDVYAALRGIVQQ